MKSHTRTSLRFLLYSALLMAGFATTATAQNGGELTMPEWISVNSAEKQVTLDIVAGKTDANNHWNFNGFAKGEGIVVVPEGYTVVLNFQNDDPQMMHSIAAIEIPEEFPSIFEEPTPVFAGAMSSNPTDMATATKPGESEVLTFTVDKAGEFALVCLIPAHGLTGMWIGFTVSAEGKTGLLDNTVSTSP